MPALAPHDLADVTYRASCAGGPDVELRLALDPEAATVEDAWNRLSAAYAAVDPRTLEILVRQPRSAKVSPVR